jgi:hypothetical protein
MYIPPVYFMLSGVSIHRDYIKAYSYRHEYYRGDLKSEIASIAPVKDYQLTCPIGTGLKDHQLCSMHKFEHLTMLKDKDDYYT